MRRDIKNFSDNESRSKNVMQAIAGPTQTKRKRKETKNQSVISKLREISDQLRIYCLFVNLI